MIKRTLKDMHQLFCFLLFDPLEIVSKFRGIPYYFRNRAQYVRNNGSSRFKFHWKNALPVLHDRFRHAGTMRGHYFWQDLWAARWLHDHNIKQHVDVGSRVDGFIGHLLCFAKVTYVDIRPLTSSVSGLEFQQGSVLELPFEDASIASLSCLHVLEHVGLGRYGDTVQSDGYIDAAQELIRVLAPKGTLLIGVPVGKEKVCFDAHRVFNVETVREIFLPLKMKEFSLIDDLANGIQEGADEKGANDCHFGCGLFVFEKE